MNIISFSLWGNLPEYMIGALENIELAKEYYPIWKCRFYFDSSVDKEWITKISDAGGETVFIENVLGPWHGMFWRFLANDDPDVDAYIVRDADSRLNVREKVAVDEWMNSDKTFHVMHDHPCHRNTAIMGGMWGCKKGIIDDMGGRVERWGKYHRKGIDQSFLEADIWPLVKDNTMSHLGYCWDARKWGHFKKFPPHAELKFNGTFVGECYDEENNVKEKDRQRALNEKFKIERLESTDA